MLVDGQVNRYASLMADLPQTRSVPVVRADFRDDGLWQRLIAEIASRTDEGFAAEVEFVEDRALAGMDEAAIAAGYRRAYPHEYRHPVVFVVDAVAVSSVDHPLLVVNLHAGVDAGRFRALPRQVQSIQNNLSLANMDYIEFASATGPDGVFRGF
jgi:hypothetical protein